MHLRCVLEFRFKISWFTVDKKKIVQWPSMVVPSKKWEPGEEGG